MSSTARATDNFELAKRFYVKDYNLLKLKGDWDGIAKFIYKRFSERYLTPLSSIPVGKKSGFCMMAIACLMVEALESFRRGWKDSNGRGESAFHSFFDNYEAFAQLRGHSKKFYKHVRCGILHQAETTGGWRIRRDKNGPIFNADSLVVNANSFFKELKKSLQDYCDKLKAENLNRNLRENAIKKLDAICNNCKRQHRRTNRIQTCIKKN